MRIKSLMLEDEQSLIHSFIHITNALYILIKYFINIFHKKKESYPHIIMHKLSLCVTGDR